MAKIWNGTKPVDCQVCGGTLGGVFYDAKLKVGPWATMCHSCWQYKAYHLKGLWVKYSTKTMERLNG